MKTYQIRQECAIQKFKIAARESAQQLQFALPLTEVLELVSKVLMNVSLVAFMKLAEEMMRWEVGELVGVKHQAQKDRSFHRWGTQPGYCVVDGQKISLERPRVRDTRQQEVPLGSYGLLQRASLMEESEWQKVMHGLTTRGYAEVVRELKEAYGVEKSTVSEHFIEGSRQRLQQLEARSLNKHSFCAISWTAHTFKSSS